MQFVLRDHVNQLIGALTNLVQGVTPLSHPKAQSQLKLTDLPIVDLPIVDFPVVDLPVVDLPIRDEPIDSLSTAALLRPWLPSIEDMISTCSLPTSSLLDFRPGDHSSIADSGVQAHGRVRDFSNLVSSFAPETADTAADLADIGRASLSECGVGEDDFSHAVDEIFEPSQSIWQNN